MDLDDVTDELYGGDLDDFMPRRTALVKQARDDGDKALATSIGTLRKPSTAAWAINAFVRASTDEVERVLDLGEAFRRAQDDLDGDELRELTRQRQALIGAVVEHVRDVAREHGRKLSESISTEVEQTFRAAMADPDAAAAVRSGALTTAISASGLGSLKISDVTASTRPALRLVRSTGAGGATSKPSRKGDADVERAERAAREAEAARVEAARRAAEQVAEAERAAEIATEQLTAASDLIADARSRRKELRAQRDQLRAELGKVESALAEAEDALAEAEDAQDAAKAKADAADRALYDAREATLRAR